MLSLDLPPALIYIYICVCVCVCVYTILDDVVKKYVSKHQKMIHSYLTFNLNFSVCFNKDYVNNYDTSKKKESKKENGNV